MKSLRSSEDPKTSWRVINRYIRGRTPRKVYPSWLKGDQTVKADLNSANTFFAETGKRVTEEIGPVDSDSVGDIGKFSNPLCELGIPSLYVIEKIIDSQGNHKAPGDDKVTSRTLKANKSFFVPVLQHLCERIFITGRNPARFKQAEVVLIHKGGDLEELRNYRPISLLSSMNKVIESCIVLNCGII